MDVEGFMNQKSGTLSGAVLCSGAILAKYLIIMPEFIIKHSGNAAWLDTIIKSIIFLISFAIVLKLYKPFAPNSFDSLFIYSTKAGKIFFNYFYAIAFIVYNAGLLRVLVEALGTVMANTAPDEYFALFIISAIFVSALYGVRSTTNLTLVFFPVILVTLTLVIIFLFPYLRTQNIMPIFGKSTNEFIKASALRNYGFMEIILLFFFSHHYPSYKEIKKSGFIIVGVVSLISVIILGVYCLCIPYPASEKFFLPLYQMTRMIKASSFLERLEPLVVFIWTGLILCSMSALTTLSSRLFAFSDNAREKGFVPIVVFLTFFTAMLPDNEISALRFYEILLDYSYILFPVLPIIIVSAARIRTRRKTV